MKPISFFFWSLALLFIGLKLTHYIDWSWWWVLSPIYGPPLFYIALFLCGALGAVVAGLIGTVFVAFSDRRDAKRRARERGRQLLDSLRKDRK